MTIPTIASDLHSMPLPTRQGIAAMFRSWRVRRSNRRAAMALMEMEDYRLRDIGLTRGDVAVMLGRR